LPRELGYPPASAAPHPLPQIFNDTLSDTCIRIGPEERLRLKSLFGNAHPHPLVPLLPGWVLTPGGGPDLGVRCPSSSPGHLQAALL